MKKLLIILLFCTILSTSAGAQVSIYSPNKQIKVELSDRNGLSFSVTDGSSLLIKSATIGLDIKAGSKQIDLSQAKMAGKPTIKVVNSDITAPFYRQASYHTTYNHAVVKLNGTGANLEFAVFDEGVAYRFVTKSIKGEYTIESETSDILFAEDYLSYLPFTTNPQKPEAMAFQATYNVAPLTQQKDLLAFLPLTIDCRTAKITIMESDLEAYPGMFFQAEGMSLKARFPRYPRTTDFYQWRKQQYVTSTENYISRQSTNRTFPWRILAISHKDTEMLDNNMVYTLASPNRISDTSWIRPGKVAWDWWNDRSISGIDFQAGINDATYKYYIDFASKYGLEYVILDEGWYVPSSGDLLTTIPEINLPELVEYGKKKNVKLILWCVFNCFDSNIDAICEHYGKMGIAGFKVDFLDRNDQTGVEMAYRIADKCARYHMLLDYHGIYAPTGINRTYPNVVNFEAVFGMEEAKWTKQGEQDMPLYDVTFPYIRLQCGYTDFTPGGFRNATSKDFQPVYSNPMTMGTRCHQIAHYIVHDSPLTMLADNPTIYEKESECTRFVASLPSLYKSMKVIDGVMGKYIVTVRTDNAGNFYVGGETNWEARDLNLDLGFLPAGRFKAEIITDGINADKVATDYRIERKNVDSTDQLPIRLASGGGFAIKLIKQ
ncbi:MAG: glycoside hydrolase family 97 protein [Bacteroidales bacterium]|nr:glycoside hydrolase family 97 protein [Bacteroidales bacterium]